LLPAKAKNYNRYERDMEEGLTAEMYRAIVALVDDRLKDIRVTREDFDRLTQSVTQLAQAQAGSEQQLKLLTEKVEHLVQAQTHTEERIRQLEAIWEKTQLALQQLAQAQARTEERVGQLEDRMGRVEAALEQLAQAQARTEQVLQQLAIQVGALSENIGYGLEDIARLVLPGYLKYRYGIQIESLERRLFQVDGRVIDIDLYGEGRRNRQRVTVVGEVKSRIYGREVSQFQKDLEAVQAQLPAVPVPLMFGYFIDISAMEAAKGEGILLIASYQPTVELQQAALRSTRKRSNKR
jgi:DNA repair exonuclease SbcCD ATPase subunit